MSLEQANPPAILIFTGQNQFVRQNYLAWLRNKND